MTVVRSIAKVWRDRCVNRLEQQSGVTCYSHFPRDSCSSSSHLSSGMEHVLSLSWNTPHSVSSLDSWYVTPNSSVTCCQPSHSAEHNIRCHPGWERFRLRT